MGWLEFAVVVGCGLVGFIIVNAVIDARRAAPKTESSGEADAKNERSTKDETRGDQYEKDDNRPWWEILGVDRNATADQVKAAFRREISKYHPDRVEGLGSELRELAERKAKEVNQAYTSAKQHRDFK